MICGSTQLWPQPTGPIHLGTYYVSFHLHQLKFKPGEKTLEGNLLQKAFKIFKDNIQQLLNEDEEFSSESNIGEFKIRTKLVYTLTRLKLNTDESYNLTIRPKHKDLIATIEGRTFFGIRHGLETLSQLIWRDRTEKGTTLRVLRSVDIHDAPKFAYRGFMLDTARNYFSVPSLKRVLIGMSASKLNVFHWHLTDSNSFPFDSPRVPQMAKYGAMSPDMVYTKEDIEDIVEFARVRGIRVVMEIDAPAHAGNGWNWGPKKGVGELALCINEMPWRNFCGQPPCGQLNPFNPNVFKVLGDLYKDILDLTQENELFHLGGDEVNLNCWENYFIRNLRTSVSSMNRENYTDQHDIWGNFTLKAIKQLEASNGGKSFSNIILWSSDLTKKPYIDRYLDKSKIIVQVWGGSTWTESQDLLTDNYRVILSHVDAWYLDCGFGKWIETGNAACDPYRTWQVIYSHRPWELLSDVKKSLILGGEACLWSELVEEPALDNRLWPRVAALAERLWSDPILTGSEYEDSKQLNDDVYVRLNTHRERLISRGLSVEGIWPRYCTQNPGKCR